MGGSRGREYGAAAGPLRASRLAFGLQVMVTVVGGPFRRSIFPASGETEKAGCESEVKPQ